MHVFLEFNTTDMQAGTLIFVTDLAITTCQIINYYHDVDGPSCIHWFLSIWILRYPHSLAISTSIHPHGLRKASHVHSRRRRSSAGQLVRLSNQPVHPTTQEGSQMALPARPNLTDPLPLSPPSTKLNNWASSPLNCEHAGIGTALLVPDQFSQLPA